MSRVQMAAVKRAVGYCPSFDFVAEVSVQGAHGFVTAREGGWSASGAVQRAQLAARGRVAFLKRAVGYAADGFRDDSDHVYKGKVGYA